MALFEDKLRAYGRELGTAHDKVGKGLMSTAQLNSLNEAHIQELLTLHRKIILGENRGESHKK
ncbi:hypothetical protein HGA64_02880 [Candidatus Falkowbacteria bacterium]|nr:hypothetical protein [Candidatus Falkowbacteria bacterium]